MSGYVQDIAEEIAENSTVCKSVQPVKPSLVARKCISTGTLTTLEPWNEVSTAHTCTEYTVNLIFTNLVQYELRKWEVQFVCRPISRHSNFPCRASIREVTRPREAAAFRQRPAEEGFQVPTEKPATVTLPNAFNPQSCRLCVWGLFLLDFVMPAMCHASHMYKLIYHGLPFTFCGWFNDGCLLEPPYSAIQPECVRSCS